MQTACYQQYSYFCVYGFVSVSKQDAINRQATKALGEQTNRKIQNQGLGKTNV